MIKANKYKFLTVRITDKQDKILEAQSSALGYLQKSQYVRAVLFMGISVEKKIDAIHRKICGDKNG